MARTHAPKDVTEQRDGSYKCGKCGAPVVRYTNPRAIWVHDVRG